MAFQITWPQRQPFTLLACHITAELRASWRDIATVVTRHALTCSHPCLVFGDFNVALHVGDIVNFEGITQPLPYSADARWWLRTMKDFHHASAPWTYLHKVSSTYRTLDRFMINTSAAALHVLGLQ
eukprot:2457037-Amphidinium_carterae.1